MTKTEAIKYGTAWLKDEYLDIKDYAFLKIALETLKQKPKIGRWLHGELIPNDITGHYYAECSVCGKIRIVDNYCPSCGTKMIEIEEVENNDSEK